MYEIHADEFPLEQTLCKDCIHRISKIIIPLDHENYGIKLEDYDLSDNETISIEIHSCNVTGEDMDHLVLACNKFENGKGIFEERDPFK
jgi:hypothetical protein